MNGTLLTQTAISAQTYNHSKAFDSEQFRFKNCPDLDKSDLFTLRNADLIEQVDDPWNTTTWEWSESGSTALRMVEDSIIDQASDDQLTAVQREADNLLRLPRNDSFLANEYDLLGEQLKTLSSADLIAQVDEVGQLAVWHLTEFALRLLTSLEAEERRVDSGNLNNTIPADD